MLDQSQLEQSVRDIIIEVCEVMRRHGYQTVCVGAIMHLIGLSAEQAAAHQDQWFDLGEDFDRLLAARRQLGTVPSDTTLH